MRFPLIQQKSSVMDIAPMVDLVFLLLVFFMIGSRFAQPSLEMKLPEASTGNISERNAIVISVDRNRRIALNGSSLSLEDLGDSLKQSLHSQPSSEVMLRVDGQVPYQLFVQIMDRCRAAGAKDMRLEYEPER